MATIQESLELGRMLQRAGQLADAEQVYRRIVEITATITRRHALY